MAAVALADAKAHSSELASKTWCRRFDSKVSFWKRVGG
jgi:hypothetical protein